MRHANSGRVAGRFPAARVRLDEVEYWGMRVSRYTTYSGIDIAERTVDGSDGAGLPEQKSRHNLLKRRLWKMRTVGLWKSERQKQIVR